MAEEMRTTTGEPMEEVKASQAVDSEEKAVETSEITGVKKPRSKKGIAAAVICSVLLAAAATAAFLLWSSTYLFVDGVRVDKTVTELELNGQDINNLSALKNYTQLERLRMQDVELTDEELELVFTSLPGCDVECTVNLCGEKFSSDAKEIRLENRENIDCEELRDKLKYFSNLTVLNLSGSKVDNDIIWEIAKKRSVLVLWDVSLYGDRYGSRTSELDFTDSKASLETLEAELADDLKYFPNLEKVILPFYGVENERMYKLAQSLDADVSWVVSFGNKKYYSGTNEITVGKDVEITIDELEDSLKYFSKLEKIDASGSKIDKDELWELRKSTGLDVVWDIEFAGEKYKTDVTEIYSEEYKGNIDMSELKYCDRLTTLSIRAGYDDSTWDWDYDYIDLKNISELSGVTTLQELSLVGCTGLEDLSSLAGLENLKTMELRSVDIKSLEGINELGPLIDLRIYSCDGVTDWSPLAELRGLEILYLNDCENLTDLTPIAGRKSLKELSLDYSGNVTDLTPLAGLTGLENLYLNNTGISDLKGLENLYRLEYLSLSQVSISDLSPLTGLKKLKTLSFWRSRVSNWSALAQLTGLESLDLISCGFSNMSLLTNLTKLERLRLDENSGVTTLAPVSGMKKLKELGISQTSVSTLAPISELKQLERLDMAYTNVTDLSPLYGLTNLEYLMISAEDYSDAQVAVLRENLPGCDEIVLW